MRIISFIFSFTALLLVRARHRIPNLHNAATINFVATGTIADKTNYVIDGAQLTVQSGSTVLGQGSSKGDGTFSITGSMQAVANNQYAAELIVSVGNGADVEKFPMTASISSGTVAFTSSQSGRFFLNANDMTGTSIQRATIQGQVTDKTSGKGVPNDELQFTIVGINAKNQTVTQNAVATTDSQGNFKIYTILQYLNNFAGGYVSSCGGYFNTIQMDLYGNTPPFYLNPSNSYQKTLTILMITGTISQTIVGIVNSETTKQPLPGVNVDLSYVILSNNQQSKNISNVQTDTKGSFTLKLGVPIYEINFELYFTLSNYLPVSFSYQPVYNLSDSTQTVYTDNIGTIELVSTIQLDSITFTGSFMNPNGSPKSGLSLAFSTIPATQNQTINTNSQGQWTCVDDLFVDKTTYQISITYLNGIGQSQSQELNETPSLKTQAAQFPVAYYVDIVQAKISGVLQVDGKPLVLSSTISLSCPAAIDKTKTPISMKMDSINNTGAYEFDFQPLAQFNQVITCLLTVQSSPQLQGTTQQVTIKAPTFQLVQNLSVQYISVLITLKGTVSDSSNVVAGVAKATVTLDLSPTDPITNTLTTTTDLNGNYQLSFNGLYGAQYTGVITVTDTPDFETFTSPSIKFDCSKAATVTQNAQLTRTQVLTTLSSALEDMTKKPIIGAAITMVSSAPIVEGFTYDTATAKDAADGTFSVNFKCYEDVQMTVTFTIVVPTYDPVSVTSPKFDCVAPKVALPTFQVNLNVSKISMIIDGKLLNPVGQPAKGIALTFSTKPFTANQSITTSETGTFSITDPAAYPNTAYDLFVDYKNALNQPKEVTMSVTPKTPGQTFDFPTIYYQDFVNATISGTVLVGKVPIAEVVSLDISCPAAFGQNGKAFDQIVATSNVGVFKATLNVLAEDDAPVVCVITSPQTGDLQKAEQNVSLSAPNFNAANVEVTTQYITVEIVIKGQVTDTSNVVTGVAKATVTLALTPADPLQNTLTTTTDANGNYQISFNGVQNAQYSGVLTVTDAPDFETFTSPSIKIDCSKPATIAQNAQLTRTQVSTILSSTLEDMTKKPIPNAQITMVSSVPSITGFTYSTATAKDAADGTFSINFKCYEDVDIIVTFSIEVPTYDPVSVTSPKFDCVAPKVTLPTFQVNLNVSKISMIIDGKLLNPVGQPAKGIALTFSTKPFTANQSITTSETGTFSITDAAAYPNTAYDLFVDYKNALNQPKEVTMSVTPKSTGQTFDFPTIYYQDFVNATISGTVLVGKVPIAEVVSLDISCPAAFGQNGKAFDQIVATSNVGVFKATLNVLAEDDAPVVCVITSPQTGDLQKVEQNVSLSAPTFTAANVEVTTQYITVEIVIKGQVTDTANVVTGVAKATVTLALTPADPLQNTLTTTTDANGNYQISFNGVQNAQYSGVLTVTDAPDFETFTSPTIKIDCSKPATIAQNAQLTRTQVSTILSSTLEDMTKKPIPNAQITMVSSVPSITGFTYSTATAKDAADGTFSINFKCYEDVDMTVTFTVLVPTYDSVSVTSTKFACVSPKVELPPLQISLEKFTIPIQISGKVLNPQGQPAKGISLTFSTTPLTTTSTVSTAADGIWNITDPNVLPNQALTLLIDYKNGLQQPKQASLNTTPTTSGQEIAFPTIYYQDLVTASIAGSVMITNKPITEIASLELSCPTAISQNTKPINETFSTTNQGVFKGTFQVLAEDDASIACALTLPQTTDLLKVTQNVVFTPPNFTLANVEVATEYNQVVLIIKGQVTDAANLVPGVAKAQVQLVLSTVDPILNTLTTTTDAQGNYQITLNGVSNVVYEGVLKVTDSPDYTDYTSAAIKLDCSKAQTLVENVVLQRNIIATNIESKVLNPEKQPIPNSQLTMVSSSPTIPGFQYASSTAKDGTDGSFTLPFKCYEDVPMTVVINVAVPTYNPVQVTLPAFPCVSPSVQVAPLVVNPSITTISVKVSGKVVDPEGQPQKGLALLFSTKPPTLAQSITTDAQGQWTVADTAVVPKTAYTYLIDYKNGLGQAKEATFEATATTDGQSIAFPPIDYQDIVTAIVQGSIMVGNTAISDVVPVELACPNTIGSDGKPLPTATVQSSNTGAYKFSVQLLAEDDVVVNCTVSIAKTTSLEAAQQTLQLKSPTFASTTNIETTYNGVAITVKGVVTDATNVVSTVQGATVTLTLSPADALSSTAITATTAQGGTYTLTFNVVSGQAYTAMLKVSDAPDYVDLTLPTLSINATASITLTQNAALQRTQVKTTVSSSLVDASGHPVPDASIALSKSTPNIAGFNYATATAKDASDGIFSIAFQCYQDVATVATFDITVPSYNPIQVQSAMFSCVAPAVKLAPIKVTLTVANITAIITAKVVTPTNTPKGSLQMTLTTQPSSESLSSMTGPDGSCTMVDKEIVPNQAYIFVLTFLDGLQETTTATIKQTLTQNNQKVVFPEEIAYPDLVSATISGTVTVNSVAVTQAITVQLSCTVIDQTKKPVSANAVVTKGSYEIDFSPLAQYNVAIPCTLTVAESVDYKAFSVAVSVSSNSSYKAVQNISLVYNYLELDVACLVNDAKGVPYPSLPLTLSTNPATVAVQGTTAADGKVSLADKSIFGSTKYSLLLSYIDFTKANISLSQDYTSTTQPTQDFTYPTIYLIQAVQGLISGIVQYGTVLLAEPINITVSCATTLSNTKVAPLTTTVAKGVFNVTLTLTANSQTVFTCTLSTQATQRLQSATATATLKSPNFNTSGIVLQTSYNSIAVTLTGTVTDATNITTGVPGVKITLTLDPADPLASSIQATTDANGKYTMPFNAVQGDVYKTAYDLVPSQDFVELKVSENPIDVTKAQTFVQNFELQRVVITANLLSTLDDMSGKPVPGAKVEITTSTPLMSPYKGDYNTQVTTQSNGDFSLPFECYRDVKYSISLSVTIPNGAPQSVPPQDITCSSESISFPAVKVETTITATLTGVILNAKKEGQGNLPLTFTVGTTKTTTTTASDGSYKVDLDLPPNSSTEVTLTFNNALGQPQSSSQTIKATAVPTQTFPVPPIYYQSLETVMLQGAIGSDGFQASNEAYTIKVNGTNQVSGAPISLSGSTDVNGGFTASFPLLAQFGTDYSVTFATPSNDKFQASSTQLLILPPTFTVSNIQVNLQETPAFAAQVKKFYSQVYIIGETETIYNCPEDSQQPIEGVLLSLLSWNGNQYVNTNLQAVSDKNGIFQIVSQLLKSSLSQTFALQISKDKFVGLTIYFVPQLTIAVRDGQQVIDLGMINLMHLGKPLPCPSSLIDDEYQQFLENRGFDYYVQTPTSHRSSKHLRQHG